MMFSIGIRLEALEELVFKYIVKQELADTLHKSELAYTQNGIDILETRIKDMLAEEYVDIIKKIETRNDNGKNVSE